MKKYILIVVLLFGCFVFLNSCSNDPYPIGENQSQTLHAYIRRPIEKLDPGYSYYDIEITLLNQICEPPLQYAYLFHDQVRMEPLTLTKMPEMMIYDRQGKLAPELTDPQEIDRVEYVLHLRKDIRYHPHPCFAKKQDGTLFYDSTTTAQEIADCLVPSDFSHQGTRFLKAEDYATGLKRLADPRTECPIYSNLLDIRGFRQLNETLNNTIEQERKERKLTNEKTSEVHFPIKINYAQFDCPGIQVIDEHTLKITLDRPYPQFIYWMSMPFFSPIPQEVIDFYTLPVIAAKELSIRQNPVGTGPFYITQYNPEQIFVLEKNPNYHDDFYPSEGDPHLREKGMMVDQGKKLPLVDRIVFRVEKDFIPAWHKFNQGYYDFFTLEQDAFDQAMQFSGSDASLSPEMVKKGVTTHSTMKMSFIDLQFNLYDPVLGDVDENNNLLPPEQLEKRRKLRQAIAMCIDVDEYINIFRPAMAVRSHSILPSNIYGGKSGKENVNPYVCQWNDKKKKAENKPIEEAMRLLSEAGFPNGIKPDGTQLTLYFDHGGGGSPGARALVDWFIRQFEKLNIKLVDRGVEASRHRDSLERGSFQMAIKGWYADYPDPENFFFLYYGPNGKVKYSGYNTANWAHPDFDKAYTTMVYSDNGKNRLQSIEKMVNVMQREVPSVPLYHEISYHLNQSWIHNNIPPPIGRCYKYIRIDPNQRAQKIQIWNQPIYWPIVLLVSLAFVIAIPACIQHYRQEKGKS